MNDLATLARLIENLIRFGTIAEVQDAPPRVRVKTGDLHTTWLPWIVARAGQDVEWDPPTIGEQVVLLSPSGQLANGVVLTGIYCDAIPANGDRAGLHRRSYRDGAVIEYDSVAHHLSAVLPEEGTTDLISKGGITIVGSIKHQGDYEHEGNYQQQGNYTQTGNQSITGQVDVTIDVVAAGKSLVSHTHTGNLDSPTSPPL